MNTINVARVVLLSTCHDGACSHTPQLVQTVHYFYAYFRVTTSNDEARYKCRFTFSVILAFCIRKLISACRRERLDTSLQVPRAPHYEYCNADA